jgi:hypothetical protein
MRISPRLRVLVGAVTTLVLTGLGASLVSGGQVWGGAVFLLLGLYRGVMWVRELRWLLEPDEDDA